MTDLLRESREDMLHDEHELLDPLGDAEEGVVKNRAKVGSARPSSLLYTYGPGAIMDLPNFSIMPAGLNDWETIWKRRDHVPTILEPRLLNVVRLHLGPQVDALRPFPWQPKRMGISGEGSDLGIPVAFFRSGSAARVVITSALCLASTTQTPIRSGRTLRSSPTRTAPAAVATPRRGQAAQPCPLSTY